MSFVSNLLNPAQGAGFQAQQASVINPELDPLAASLQTQAQGGINQQQDFLNQLGAQGGIGNQSSVFAQQQGLANQLGLQAQGGGPNPAQAQLAQNTAANTANQAALMAGQRGSGSNAGLIARQAAMQGGANQQNMVGQQATLQAQQQLAAQQALMQQQAQMAGLATQQVGQQQGALNNYNQFAQGEQGQVLGAIQGQNSAMGANAAQANSANAGIAKQNAALQGQLFTGAINGAATAMMADGGQVKPSPSPTPGPDLPGAGSASQGFKDYSGWDKLKATLGFAEGGQVGPKSSVVQYMKGYSNRNEGLSSRPGLQDLSSSGGFPQMSHGGEVPAMVSPGERYLPPQDVKKVASGEKSPIHAGKKVPGKAEVKGDSLKNDKVSAKLEEGGIVIPRSIMQSKDAEKRAHDFISQVLARQGMRKKA